MTNAWNVTEAEYRKALKLSREGSTPPKHSAAYWQLCRFYRGQIFIRDEAALAVRLIRGKADRTVLCFEGEEHELKPC